MHDRRAMSIFEPIPATIRDDARTRRILRGRPRTAVLRQIGNVLMILGLGLAIGLMTATYEIDRQERAARPATR